LQLTENGEQKIGRVRNGYGWETAKVLAKNNPAAWLKDALIKELQTSGYKISNGGAIQLEGSLVHMDVDLFMKYKGSASFNIQIKKGDKILYADSFHGESSETAWFATAEEYGKAAEETLRDAFRKAMPKITSKLEMISEDIKCGK